MRTSIVAVAVLAVLFAGCMGGGPAADDGNATDGNVSDDGTMSTDDGSGTFELLISDQPNAIGDFDSLNVTFSHARIFSAGEDADETDGNATEAGNGTDDGDTDDGNETEADDGQGGFETLDLDNASVDLTTVVGDNATPVGAVDLEPGTYGKVELHVASVDGVVANESVDVKVPSEKLMITKQFTVEANETTEFVFDISVVEKGDGSYNLLPVISESGVAGEDVDVQRRDRDEADGEHDGAMEDDGMDDAMNDTESDGGDADGGNATDAGGATNASA